MQDTTHTGSAPQRVWTKPHLMKVGTIADVAGTKNTNTDGGGGHSVS
jgi:hypothetical protein